MEAGETPEGALMREVLEETGFEVTVGELIGLYSTPAKDALAISFRAQVIARHAWRPTTEIGEFDFFARDALPAPMRSHTRERVRDAFDGVKGVVRATAVRKAATEKLVRVS